MFVMIVVIQSSIESAEFTHTHTNISGRVCVYLCRNTKNSTVGLHRFQSENNIEVNLNASTHHFLIWHEALRSIKTIIYLLCSLLFKSTKNFIHICPSNDQKKLMICTVGPCFFCLFVFCRVADLSFSLSNCMWYCVCFNI